MPPKILTRPNPPLTDDQIDKALLILPPLHDNVMVVVQHLAAQITALAQRVTNLEEA